MTTYATVAIPYVNAAPHLGYAFELVEADVFVRPLRLAGEPVRFLGGTDDYSLKNVLAAQAAGVSTRAFVDAHAARFASLARSLEVSFDDFIQTSSGARHAPTATRPWNACKASDDLYRRRYEGWYCVGCEQFYELAAVVDGRCAEHEAALEFVCEENWFFRVSRYTEQIMEIIESGVLVVAPRGFRDEVLAFLRGGLHD